MAIPSELQFSDEEEFRDKFLVPLLGRLGFSVVMDNHGRREFGRDIIFGEVDRFGHVVYHGLQAKHVPSVSLGAIEEVINDAKQAFMNPFHHKQTGRQERISTFFAVNAGTISDEAATHFFNSLQVPFGGNVRLLDGKTLLNLDRLSHASRTEWVLQRVMGVIFEIRVNRQTVSRLVDEMGKYLRDEGGYPIVKLRLTAIEAYLQTPFVQGTIEDYNEAQEYWHLARSANELAQALWYPLSTREYNQKCLRGLESLRTMLLPLMDRLEARMASVLATIRPLAPL